MMNSDEQSKTVSIFSTDLDSAGTILRIAAYTKVFETNNYECETNN